MNMNRNNDINKTLCQYQTSYERLYSHCFMLPNLKEIFATELSNVST